MKFEDNVSLVYVDYNLQNRQFMVKEIVMVFLLKTIVEYSRIHIDFWVKNIILRYKNYV